MSFAQPLAVPEPPAERSSENSEEHCEEQSLERFAHSRTKHPTGDNAPTFDNNQRREREEEEEEAPSQPPRVRPPGREGGRGGERGREKEKRPMSASGRFLLDGCCLLLRLFGRAALLVVGVLEAKIVWAPLGDEL